MEETKEINDAPPPTMEKFKDDVQSRQQDSPSRTYSRFESPGRYHPSSIIDVGEQKTLIDKAVDILKEQKIEPTNDIMDQLNKLEQQAVSKESFLDSVMQMMTQLLKDRPQSSELIRKAKSQLDYLSSE